MTSATTQQRLAACLTTLRADIAQCPDGNCRMPRFDRQLFRCSGTRLADYLHEAEGHFRQLFAADINDARRAWLAEKLVNQIAALQREASTQQIRPRREQPLPNPGVQKLEEYQEYERRLQTMINQREQRLAQAESLKAQQQLKQELEVLEARIARCRQAIHATGWALSLRSERHLK